MPKLVPTAVAFANKPLRAKLADPAGMRGVLVQCFVENGINNPFLYFPIFYTCVDTANPWARGRRSLAIVPFLQSQCLR